MPHPPPVRFILIGLFGIAALGLATFELTRSAHSEPPEAPNQALLAGAAEIGLTPEALVVSGLHESAEIIFQRLNAASVLCAAVVANRESLSHSEAAIVAAESALGLDPTNETLLAQRALALAQAAAASQAIAETRQQLSQAVLSDLPGEQVVRFQTFQQSVGREVSPAFRAATRADAQWRALEQALVAERRSQRVQRELDPEQAELLTQVRAEPPVVTAQASLTTHLGGVRAQYDQALGFTTNP